jgi:hypothetical protein
MTTPNKKSNFTFTSITSYNRTPKNLGDYDYIDISYNTLYDISNNIVNDKSNNKIFYKLPIL